MSRIKIACVVFALGAFASLAYLSNSPGLPLRAAPKADRDRPEVREIELSAIYSTSYQKNLERVYRHLPEDSPERKALESIDDRMRESRSPPLVALVRGEDIKEAVLATARFIGMKEPPARPVGPDEKSASKKHWLFAHIAHTGSSPPQWLIYPPTVFGAKVRFTYTRFDGWFTPEGDESTDVSADDHAYFYWVPLGVFEDSDQIRAEMVEFCKSVKASYPAGKR